MPIGALMARASLCFSERRYDEAAALYREAIAHDRLNVDALCNLAGVAYTQGRMAAAIAGFSGALVSDPCNFPALANLSQALRQSGDFRRAARELRRAALLSPGDAPLRRRLGDLLRKAAAPRQAAAVFRRLLVEEPDDPVSAAGLSAALQECGQLHPGVALARRAARLNPGWAAAAQHWAQAELATGNLDACLTAYRQAIAAEPTNPAPRLSMADAERNAVTPAKSAAQLGIVLALDPASADALAGLADAWGRQARFDRAETMARRALRVQPHNTRAHNNLGVILLNAERFEDACVHFRRACRDGDLRADILSNYGSALKGLGLLDQALAILRRALALDPVLVQAYNNFGNTLREYGWAEAAAGVYDHATRIAPDYLMAYRNLLPTLLYSPRWTHAERFAAHRRFEDSLARRHYASIRPHANPPDPARRLRIGYLSSDFRSHVVARNIKPLFEHRNRADFTVVGYAEVSNPDGLTAEFRALCDGWVSTVGLEDEKVAEAIRADGIDILVCLAGHFDRNRPLVCAHKPAPIQISFHDPATSGLETMDYLIADPVLVPRGGAEPFVERVIRLPSYYLASPPVDAPGPGEPPCLRTGRITFGCFNVPSKITPEVIALWARVLLAVPDSRLLLKYRNLYGVPGLRDGMAAAFADRGVEPSRLVFRSSVDASPQHAAGYLDVDIALDPFPFCGSTTTYEALWMGVPVVTWPQDVMVSRWTASMLRALDLDSLVARSADEYVDLCRGLATDTGALTSLRAGLRPRIAASSLCDGKTKARQLERLYRAVWRRWCAGRAA